jgi:hypothetical protein
VAHPPTSIALQSWGIPPLAIQVLLLAMRAMQYTLKTGFCKLEESVCRTASQPNLGLGQGSRTSPPAFMALSFLLVKAYQGMGHGAHINLLYSHRLFVLAVVMYVDGADLLHWITSSCTSPEELIQHVQNATPDLGNLSQVSRGILKPAKCSVYLIVYKFVWG